MAKNARGRSKVSIDPRKEPPHQTPSQPLLWFALLLLVVNWIAYANSFQTGWHFDDGPNIIGNDDVLIPDLSWRSLAQALLSSPGGKRPLSYLSFALNYYFCGPEAASFHVVNFIIHCLNGILVLKVLSLLLRTASPNIAASRVRVLAFLGAALWSASPLQTQSVTYVVQRMNLLSAFFSLVSFWFFLQWRLKARRSTHLWLCLACWLLALGSKENCFLLPLCFVAYEWAFGERRFFRPRNWLIGAIAFCLLTGFTLWRYDLVKRIHTDYSTREFTMKERLLTQPRVVTFHLSQLLLPLPSRFALRHEVEKSTSLFSPLSTLLSTGLLAVIAGAAFIWRNRNPLFSFSISWFFINLLVESSFLPLELVYEHRMYLPSVGIFAALLSPVVKIVKFPRGDVYWKIAQYAGAFLILLSATFSFARNQDWKDEVTLWADNVRKYPKSFRSLNNLGTAFAKAGRMSEAEDAFRRAVEADPLYPPARANLGLAYLNQGRTAEAVSVIRDFFETSPWRTTRLANFNAEVYFNFGAIYAKAGMLEMAIVHYGQAVNRKPDYPEAWFNLALAYQQTGKNSDAADCFREFLRRWKGPADSPYVADATQRIKSLRGEGS